MESRKSKIKFVDRQQGKIIGKIIPSMDVWEGQLIALKKMVIELDDLRKS